MSGRNGASGPGRPGRPGGTKPEELDALEREIQSYHDDELAGLARWRFERRLRRSPELQRRLGEIAALGRWLRESHVEGASPDLWERIALRLPATDARRAEAAAPRGLGWLAWPGAALASLGVAALVVSRWLAPEAPTTAGVVRWLDSGGRDVMVLEASPDTTIIWVLEGPAKAATQGGGRELV